MTTKPTARGEEMSLYIDKIREAGWNWTVGQSKEYPGFIGRAWRLNIEDGKVYDGEKKTPVLCVSSCNDSMEELLEDLWEKISNG